MPHTHAKINSLGKAVSKHFLSDIGRKVMPFIFPPRTTAAQPATNAELEGTAGPEILTELNTPQFQDTKSRDVIVSVCSHFNKNTRFPSWCPMDRCAEQLIASSSDRHT